MFSRNITNCYVWQLFYPEELQALGVDDQPDLIDDLLGLDMAVVMKQMSEMDSARRRFGWLLQMWECYGAGNPASSFCERMISVANDVMTDGRTVLDDDLLEAVAILRMNRKFIEMMKNTHGHLVNRILEEAMKELATSLYAKPDSAPANPPTADLSAGLNIDA